MILSTFSIFIQGDSLSSLIFITYLDHISKLSKDELSETRLIYHSQNPELMQDLVYADNNKRKPATEKIDYETISRKSKK